MAETLGESDQRTKLRTITVPRACADAAREGFALPVLPCFHRGVSNRGRRRLFQAVGRALQAVKNAVENFFIAGLAVMTGLGVMAGCLGVITVIALLLYGLVVIVFREAFGVSLPNPFDWF